MSSDVANTVKPALSGSAVAIAQEDGKLKAVELRRREGGFEVLWAKSSEGDDRNLGVFAVECGLSVGSIGRTEKDGDRIVVVGFGSAGVAFYRISAPAVKEKEIEALVKLQAETRLPLPSEQVELAWRAGRIHDNEMTVTIAAGRRERLQEFVENVRGLKPGKILLDCEGVVKAWRTFFGGNASAGDAVIVSMGVRSTQVCLAEDGQLSNAAVLDTGVDDLSGEEPGAEQTETTEGFVQDMRSVLELFGYAEPDELPVFVLSSGSEAINGVVSSLVSAGLDARVAEPLSKELGVAGEIGAEELYEYRVPIGLALMRLESEAELNIFGRLYRPSGEEKKRHWLYSPKVACAVAAVMLVMLVIVLYAVDAASPGAIEKRLNTSVSDADMSLLVQRQKLIRTVATERPDLLELLNLVNSGGSKGVLLDSLQFKKGQPVSITGQADSPDMLYKFQESLLTKNGIKQVEIQNATKDPKGDKFKFTITFHYKNFTKKGTAK